jgi:hypothetical protein
MKHLVSLSLLALCANAHAQEWNQRADLAGVPRWGAMGFGIGTKGYICMGTDGTNILTDLWEWDQATDSWQQRASFPGIARREGVSFSIGSIGYVGFGRTGVGQNGFSDLWAYDPATDSWDEKASMPAVGRSAPSAFVLDGKAYIACGNPNYTPYLDELWEYDPASDAWTQHTSLPATGRSGPVAFAVSGKGYVGSGNDNSSNAACSDFWQWDPATDSWSQRTDLPGEERRTACYFALEDDAIAGGGWNGTDYFVDFYLYHPIPDTWSPIPQFEGLGAHTPVSFNVNGKGYVGTGGIPGGQTDQYWEFDKGGNSNAIAEEDGLDGIRIVRNDRSISLLGWSRDRADHFVLLDASGRIVSSGALNSGLVQLPTVAGYYVLRLSNESGEQRCWSFAHAG